MDSPGREIEVRVYGLPAPQGSKRHIGRGILVESSKRVRPWRTSVVHACIDLMEEQQLRGVLPIQGPVDVEVEFLFPRPQSHYGTGRNAEKLKPSAPHYTTSTRDGDLDKVLRSTIDGLAERTGGVMLRDDRLVVSVTATKRYTNDGESPGAMIIIRDPD